MSNKESKKWHCEACERTGGTAHGINYLPSNKESWEEEFKKYQDAMARTLRILKEEGYLGEKTVKDYETIKAFPNLISQLLAKAKEQGKIEMALEKNQLRQLTVEEIRQQATSLERARIIQIIESSELTDESEMVRHFSYNRTYRRIHRDSYNAALRFLKSKLHED